MAADYEKVAAKVQGLVGVGSINCDEEKELCGMLQIKGFPTLKLFGATPNKKGTKDPDDYQGPRTTAAMANAALALLDAKNIQIAKKDNLKTVLADKKAAVLFAAKAEPSNLFKSLSMQFGKRLSFVLSADKEAAAQFDVKTFPTLIVTDNGAKVEAYSGKPNIEDMIAFLDKFAVPKPEKKTQQPEKEAPPAPKVEYDKVVDEIKTEEQWLAKCDVKAGFCGVAMLDPEEEGGEERHKKVSFLLLSE
jgi:protein disulfide-isomerase A6